MTKPESNTGEESSPIRGKSPVKQKGDIMIPNNYEKIVKEKRRREQRKDEEGNGGR